MSVGLIVQSSKNKTFGLPLFSTLAKVSRFCLEILPKTGCRTLIMIPFATYSKSSGLIPFIKLHNSISLMKSAAGNSINSLYFFEAVFAGKFAFFNASMGLLKKFSQCWGNWL